MTRSSLVPVERIESIEDLDVCLSQSDAFRLRHKRPFVTITYAQSVDGSIASRNRRPIHLSGPESSRLTHQIRAGCDAILIGIGTLLADDPRLTVRLVEGRNPQPIILDTCLRTPPGAKLVQRSDPGAWIVQGDHDEEKGRSKRSRMLEKAGATLLPCATTAGGRIDLSALMKLLADRQINSIMVEGGAKVITSFVNAGLVDQFIITVSPRLVGGLQVIDSRGLSPESNLKLDQVSYQHLGHDLIIWARPLWSAT